MAIRGIRNLGTTKRSALNSRGRRPDPHLNNLTRTAERRLSGFDGDVHCAVAPAALEAATAAFAGKVVDRNVENILARFAAMWRMIGALAELERSLISERTRAGMKGARGRGVKFGRKPKLTPEQIAHARKLIRKGEARQ
jgi:hypothetical protein